MKVYFVCWRIFLFMFILLDHVFSFTFKGFFENPDVSSEITFFGDAEIVNNGSSVQITKPSAFSAGRIMYKNPIKIVEQNPRQPVSFQTYIVFSISRENGDGLAFVILPGDFHQQRLDGHSFGLSPGLNESKGIIAVEFDTYNDDLVNDINGNHVGIDVGTLISSKSANVSDTDMVLNSGEKLHCWIDYYANAKTLEVRLSKFGAPRSMEPLLSFPIDISEICTEEVFVGLSSSNGNSTQTSCVYSWSFRLNHSWDWVHSEPLNPRDFPEDVNVPPSRGKGSNYLYRNMPALLFGIGCGAAIAVLILFALFSLVNKPLWMNIQYPIHPLSPDCEKAKMKDRSLDSDKK